MDFLVVVPAVVKTVETLRQNWLKDGEKANMQRQILLDLATFFG